MTRAPVLTFAEAIPVRDGRADPQLALWVEAGEAPPTEAEQKELAARAQAALAEAAQGLGAPDDGGLLVVRAQGVTRTGGRRGNQVAAGVGIAVAIVVVIVVAVIVIASMKDAPKTAKASPAKASAAPSPARAAPSASPAPVPRGGGGTVKALPVPSGGGVRPAPRPSARPAPPPGYAPVVPNEGVVVWGDPWVNWYFAVDLTPRPPPAPTPYVVQGVQQPVGSYVLAPSPAPGASPGPGLEEDVPAPEELTEVRLDPPAPLPVDERGFFAGDEVLVELVVVDRVTGEPRLRKLARKNIDPTDVAELRAFLREAAGSREGWENLAAPPAG